MSRNRVKVNILGNDYLLSSEEDEAYVHAVAADAEKRMASILRNNLRASNMTAAVLTALDYCDEAKKAADSADNLRSQIKDYLEESSKARMEADEAKREISRLKKEVQTLRMRLAEADSTPPAGSGRTAPPAPISRPVQNAAPAVPEQARLFKKSDSDSATREIMNFFEAQGKKAGKESEDER